MEAINEFDGVDDCAFRERQMKALLRGLLCDYEVTTEHKQ